MLTRAIRAIKAFLGFKGPEGHPPSNRSPEANPKRSLPYVAVGDFDGNVHVVSQAQLDKRTHFQPGETYRLGECIVTVHASKEAMLASIAATDAKRTARHEALTARGVDLMLMSPEDLLTLKLDAWLAKKAQHDAKVEAKIGRKTKKGRYIPSTDAPISGDKSERFKQLTKPLTKVK